ncbi:MAG: HAD hydrolase-like protein, partial [Hydrogenoanaerobacterium sp.]
DDTTEHKPKPEPMLLYLSRTGVRADEVLYIGDTVYDYQCATGAGVPFALAGWGALNADEVPPCYAPKTPGEVLLLL